MKKVITISFILIIGIFVVAIFNRSSASTLEAFTEGKTTREVVETLERGNFSEVEFAYALSDGIHLSANNETENLSLTDDEFYVSIAPFINFTHDCFRHVFTGCRAELADTEIAVKITNSQGEVVFDGIKETYENGFMGFWLPRNETYTIEFNYGEYGGVFEFSTADNQPTCLTKFQLEKQL